MGKRPALPGRLPEFDGSGNAQFAQYARNQNAPSSRFCFVRVAIRPPCGASRRQAAGGAGGQLTNAITDTGSISIKNSSAWAELLALDNREPRSNNGREKFYRFVAIEFPSFEKVRPSTLRPRRAARRTVRAS